MQEGVQLELDFAVVVQAAMADLEQADFGLLWRAIEPLLERGTEWEQLQVAGEAIGQLVAVYQQKAEQLLSEWEERHNLAGPVMREDLLDGLVQRTMYLDVSELVRQPQGRSKRQRQRRGQEDSTIVGVVDKEKVLAFLDAEAAETVKQQALEVAYAEKVSEWREAIVGWMREVGSDRVGFSQLCKGVKLARVEVWLALLLGEFELKSEGEFYGDRLWVSLAKLPASRGKRLG